MSDTATNNNRRRGRVIRFIAEKHFGFIRPDGGSKPCFFHITDFNGDVEPASGDIVTYALGEDSRGRSKAVEVAPEG